MGTLIIARPLADLQSRTSREHVTGSDNGAALFLLFKGQ
jgi:hypothetical protein